jgi:uncharacterized protein (TIGR00730 family)
MSKKEINSVCVYCASSSKSKKEHLDLAYNVGKELAHKNKTVVYGGGSFGLMGAVAKGALENGGKVIGIIPKFMDEVEWSNKDVTQLIIVETMHERKQKMYELSDATITLPGGTGTFDELFESLCFKRLGLYDGPVVVANFKNFYDPLIKLFDNCVDENFLTLEHKNYCYITEDMENLVDVLDDIGFSDSNIAISSARVK